MEILPGIGSIFAEKSYVCQVMTIFPESWMRDILEELPGICLRLGTLAARLPCCDDCGWWGVGGANAANTPACCGMSSLPQLTSSHEAEGPSRFCVFHSISKRAHRAAFLLKRCEHCGSVFGLKVRRVYRAGRRLSATSDRILPPWYDPLLW